MRFAVLLLCFVALWGASIAASPGEVIVLEKLMFAFPALLNVNPWDQYGNDEQDWGGSWVKPLSSVCSGSDGWDIYGIYCESGAIFEIRFTNAWGERNGSSVDLAGLAWFSVFTTTADLKDGNIPSPTVVEDFFKRVLEVPSVKQVDVTWKGNAASSKFPYTEFQTHQFTHVKLDLALGMSLPVFSSINTLEKLQTNIALSSFSAVSSSSSSLHTLIINAPMSSLTALSGFPVLEELEFRAPYVVSSDYNANFAIPTSLRKLTLYGWGGASMSIGGPTSQLTHLSINSATLLTNIAYLPTSLVSLEFVATTGITDWTPSFSSCQLTSFTLSSYGSVLPMDLLFCPYLETLILDSVAPAGLDSLMAMDPSSTMLTSLTLSSSGTWPGNDIKRTAAEAFICNVPASLRHLNLGSSQFSRMMPCIDQFNGLEGLIFSGNFLVSDTFHLVNVSTSLTELAMTPKLIGADATGGAWSEMTERFPNLKKLKVYSGLLNYPLPAIELMNLVDLESLELLNLGLTGFLPVGFFDAMRNLSYFDISGNTIGGTIPTYGWHHLKEVILTGNSFSEWPYLDSPGAPELVSLTLNQLPLQSIPDTESFLTMPKLRHLNMVGSTNAQAIFPTFWANGDHKLRNLILTSSGFEGSLPAEISSPYIRHLALANNRLCGSLPTFTAPAALTYLNLDQNRLSGTIPDSWGYNLTITAQLTMSDNLLNGTLPNPLLHPYHQGGLMSIFLQNNYFTGPVPDMNGFVTAYTFNVTGSSMTLDWCARDPGFPAYATCALQPDPSICTCTSAWSTCFPTISDYCVATVPSSAPETSPSPPRSAILPPIHNCAYTPENMLPPGLIIVPSLVPPLSAPPSDCPPPSPGPTFQCLGGTWTSVGPVIQQELTVPGTTIVIDGNLTVTGNVIFNGLESQIIVNGCIFLGENLVNVELTQEELKKLGKEGELSKTLLIALTACPDSSDLTATQISAYKGGKIDCRRIKAENSGSTTMSLVATFKLDNSKCNTKWIILGGVLGGVIVIGAIITILLVTFNSSVRASVRPFAKP